MSDTPKHTTITTFEDLPDGTQKKKTESYHEKLASIKEERVERIQTDHDQFLNHLMQAIRVMTEGKTTELNLLIKAKGFGQPALITKSYVTYREEFKKR